MVSPMLLKRLADAVGIAYELLFADETDQASKVELLPPRPLLVVGRDKDFVTIIERFKTDLQTSECSVQAITAVRGWPGVGKTTTAAALLYRPEVREMFPHGTLWISLGQAPDLQRLLHQWARALGDTACTVINDVEEVSRRIAGRLSNQRMLLAIDDVWQSSHARLFLVGGPRCGMLVTTRLPRVAEELTPSPAHRYNLDVLDEEQATQLLSKLAYSTVTASPITSRELVRELEGLPLAIVVAGRLLEVEAQRRLKGEPGRSSVQRLLEDIRAGAAALLNAPAPADMADLISQTTPSVAILLRKSVEVLDAQTRERFAYLGSFAPKPAIVRLEDMAVVWQIPTFEAEKTAVELIDRGLLEPVDEGKFWMHALIVCLADSLCAE